MKKQTETTGLLKSVQPFKVFNKYNNQPDLTGTRFKKKSMTIPGQNVTPQEIIRGFTEGSKFREFFIDENLSSFDRMDKMEKIDFLTDLSARNQQMKTEIDLKIAVLKDKAEKDQKAKYEQELRDKAIAEFSKRDKSNDAK